ncbi:MAG: TMEM165/GDT1 family protein [Candidatus Latescibacterota bacterium]|jgi:putative Ca2+/H+ antiporter (TMEM165/GDT1 family)
MLLLTFLVSLGVVTLAEMGDKTQLLAMAFATRYRFFHVLLGVFIATIANHSLAVAFGNYLTRFESAEGWIQALAAFSFIFFGLWTIRGDTLEGEDKKTTRFGPVITVAIAFFIAELGDKTQLATFALAARFPAHPFGILMGTTLGMLIADAIGIGFGVLLCKRIPDDAIKMISATVFILFGFYGIFQVSRDMFSLSLTATAIVLTVLGLITGISIKMIRSSSKMERMMQCLKKDGV